VLAKTIEGDTSTVAVQAPTQQVNDMTRPKELAAWSSGKDSAWALHEV
jgi:hypothetical protein